MSRIDLWSKSVPRVELDQRAREARLRLEQVQRLAAGTAAAASGLELILRLAGSGIFGGRTRRVAADRRSRRVPEFADVAILTCSPRDPSRAGGNGARRPMVPETSVVRSFRRAGPAGPKAPPAHLGRLRAC